MPRLPEQLLNTLEKLDVDIESFVAAHGEDERITSIRLNPFKKAPLDFKVNEKVPWSNDGYYLDCRPAFTLDPLFHAGCYYVQEPGSMFIEHALASSLDISRPLKVLDLCGAPGGKSTLIDSILTADSLLVANETVKSRADILNYNLGKWGTNNTIVTNNDPSRFGRLEGYFDAIVIDAPCSGSGLFRKQPEAIGEWSQAHVRACSLRQREIISQALPALAAGGVLIYSTCSYSPEENEEVVRWLTSEFEMENLNIPVPSAWNILEGDIGYRFYPHLVKSEGFYCAVMRRTGTRPEHPKVKLRSPQLPLNTDRELISSFVPSGSPVIKINEQFHLVNEQVLAFLGTFEKQFYLKKAGVVIGEIKGRNLVPNQELAWSIYLNEWVTTVDLGREDAIRFLRKENFNGWQNEKGLILFTYKNFGIGWGKALENRMNNYLPNGMRILK